MIRRKYSYLFICLFVVGTILWQMRTVQQLKDQIAQDEKPVQSEKPVVKEPPTAAPGKKWVPHGDHFHEVPIDAPDTWQGEPQEPVMSQKQHIVDPSAKVIYPHQELLDTHPVEALRAQARDSGHWSAKYIPPFPADDEEANELAKAIYIKNYYDALGDLNHPIRAKAQEFITLWNVASYDPYPRSARVNDLAKFNWTYFDGSSFGDLYFEKIYPIRKTTFTQEDFDRANNK